MMHFGNIYILLSHSFDVLKQIVSNLIGSFRSNIYIWYFQNAFFVMKWPVVFGNTQVRIKVISRFSHRWLFNNASKKPQKFDESHFRNVQGCIPKHELFEIIQGFYIYDLYLSTSFHSNIRIISEEYDKFIVATNLVWNISLIASIAIIHKW